MLSCKRMGKAEPDYGKDKSESKQLNAPRCAIDYYANLGREDYYHKGGEPPGVWTGHAADILGLSGQVNKEVLRSVFYGFDPNTGDKLTRSSGPNHMAGWDLTFSAPKSVSVLWALADENTRAKISQLCDQAVNTTLKLVEERVAQTRKRLGKEVVYENVKGLIVAKYEHCTSRDQDVQLHIHALLANCALLLDGNWGTLEGKRFFEWRTALGRYFRAEFSHLLAKEMGLVIKRDRRSFSIVGVPMKVLRYFSKRRQTIVDEMTERGWNTAKGAALVTEQSRPHKRLVKRPKLLKEWQEQSDELGFGPEQAKDLIQAGRDRINGLGSQEPDSGMVEPFTAIGQDDLVEQLLENNSTFAEPDVWRIIGEASQGVQDHRGVTRDATQFMARPDIVRLEMANERGTIVRYSTEAMCDMERDMVEMAVRRKQDTSHHLPQNIIDRAIEDAERSEGYEYSDEQKGAVNYVCRGSGGIACIRGDAGSGKSTAMLAVRHAFERSGYRVIGSALAGIAAVGLEEKSGTKSDTVRSLLHSLDEGKITLNEKSLVVLDEAGMVGTRDFFKLIQYVEKAGAKFLPFGDEKQIQAVEAGGAFKAIVREVGAVFHMTENWRQSKAKDWLQRSVKHIAKGEIAEALALYHQEGRLHVLEDRPEAIVNMAERWLEAWKHRRPDESVNMTVTTRQEAKDANDWARHRMREEGLLGEEISCATDSGPLDVAVGDRLLFTRKSRLIGLENGFLGTVLKVQFAKDEDHKRLTVRLDNGNKVVFTMRDYNNIAHGYATTTHKSQGATYTKNFVLTGGSMVDRELTYVQVSRHKEDINLFVDKQSIEELVDNLRPTENMVSFAKDLAKKKGLEYPQNCKDSFRLTRDFLDRHSEKELGYKVLDPALKPLEGLIYEMKRSRQKDTTLDYDSFEYDVKQMLKDSEEKKPQKIFRRV